MNSRGYLPSREAGWGSWWHSDSARVSHHSYKGSISALCGYLIKVTLVTHEKSFVQFDSSKNRRGFCLGTPVSTCSDSGTIRCGPYWIS